MVVLAANAIDKLIAAGKVLPGSASIWWNPAWPLPCARAPQRLPVGTEDEVRRAVQCGGVAELFHRRPAACTWRSCSQRWGILDEVRSAHRGAAAGRAGGFAGGRWQGELGFQQLSRIDEPARHRRARAVAARHPDDDGFFRWRVRRSPLQHRPRGRCWISWRRPRWRRSSSARHGRRPDTRAKVRAGEPAGQSLRTLQDVTGRKVRAPVDKVPGNAWGARAHGKCNRE